MVRYVDCWNDYQRELKARAYRLRVDTQYLQYYLERELDRRSIDCDVLKNLSDEEKIRALEDLLHSFNPYDQYDQLMNIAIKAAIGHLKRRTKHLQPIDDFANVINNLSKQYTHC